MPATFEQLCAHLEKTAEAHRNALPIAAVRKLGLRIVYACEVLDIGLKGHTHEKLLRVILAKLSNETLSVAACVDSGSLFGAYHHVRAIVEMTGTVHYLLSDAGKLHERSVRFFTFAEFQPWKRVTVLEMQRKSGKITEDQFRARRGMISDALIGDVSPERIEQWCRVFDVKKPSELYKVNQWHRPDTFVDLLWKSDATGESVREYEMFSHVPHLSPVGQRLTGQRNPAGIGFTHQVAKVSLAVTARRVLQVLVTLDGVLDARLQTALEPELGECVALVCA